MLTRAIRPGTALSARRGRECERQSIAVRQLTLWRARTESLTYLRRQRSERIEVLEEIFRLIDRCVDAYEALATKSPYAEVCGLTPLKAKNLAVGSYSLVLDGLAQEAGALLRPFIEYTELLTYFRHFPERIKDALSNSLPQAGERSKAIQGIYQQFRSFLNKHASHSSYSEHSLAHLLEPGTHRFKKLQVMVPFVLDTNVRDLAVQLVLLAQAAVEALEHVDRVNAHSLASDWQAIHSKVFKAFALEDADRGAG